MLRPEEHPVSVGLSVSDQEFAAFQRLVHREAGIYPSEAKRSLLVGRLARRLRELGLRSLTEYHRRVVRDDDERVRLLDAICTNETHFFREPRQFEFLQRQVFPRWRREAEAGARPRRVRAWSAACSTGEEPYSLAMALRAGFPAGWSFEVVATDLSTRALAKAQAALFPLERSSEIPPSYLKAFMLRGRATQQGFMKVGPEIRSMVRFGRVNLNHDVYPIAGPFDLILCRNVLIYFDPASKPRVIQRLLRHLAADGYFLMGHAESLGGMPAGARSVGPTVYVRGEPPSADRGRNRATA